MFKNKMTYEEMRKREKRIISIVNIIVLGIGFGFMILVLSLITK